MPVRVLNTTDDFLGHRPSGGDRGGNFKSWKDQDKPLNTIDVVLHRVQRPAVVWVHPFPEVKVIEDKDTKESEKRVFGQKLVCWEEEELLKKQHFFKRSDPTEREVPALYCGFCNYWSWVRSMIKKGKLGLATPLFHFPADRPDEVRDICAGGFGNMLKGDKLSDADKAMLKKKGIHLDEAWKMSGTAAANYIFTAVDVAHLEDGVSVYQEGPGLGDWVQSVISDAMQAKVLGREKGDPFKHPYCIQWEYKPKEKDPKKKYHARRLEGVRITPKILALIDGPAPDVRAMLKPYDQKVVRAQMEQYCVLPKNLTPPWADLFAWDGPPPGQEEEEAAAPAEDDDAPEVGRGMDDPDDAEEGEELGAELMAEATDLGELTEPDEDGRVFDAQGREVTACDDCDKPILVEMPTCPHCGKVYEEAPVPPPPPAPKLRSRSTATKPSEAKKAAAAPAQRGAAPARFTPARSTPAKEQGQGRGFRGPQRAPEPPPVDLGEDGGEGEEPNDEIPF